MLALVLFLRFLCLVLPTIVAALPLNPDSELAQPTEERRNIAFKQIQSLPAHRQRRSHEQQGVAASIHQSRALVSITQSIHSRANFTIRQSGPFTATISFDAFVDLNKGKTETPVGIELVGTVDDRLNVEVETLVWVGAQVHKRAATVSGNLDDEVPLAISTPYVSSTGRLYLRQTAGYNICVAELKGFYRLPFVTTATPFYVRIEAFRWISGMFTTSGTSSLPGGHNITLSGGRILSLSSPVNATSSEIDTA